MFKPSAPDIAGGGSGVVLEVARTGKIQAARAMTLPTFGKPTPTACK
jgi:hypothetical protein